MHMIYRLWAKVHKPELEVWDVANVEPWDAAVKGSSALRAAILSMFHDELAALSQEEVIRIFWDMEKFYDNIHIGKLIQRAKEYGYPIRTFALGIQMHLAPRIVKAHGNLTMCKQPSNGIIAGCTQSNKFAGVFLFPTLRDIYEEIGRASCRERV